MSGIHESFESQASRAEWVETGVSMVRDFGETNGCATKRACSAKDPEFKAVWGRFGST